MDTLLKNQVFTKLCLSNAYTMQRSGEKRQKFLSNSYTQAKVLWYS